MLRKWSHLLAVLACLTCPVQANPVDNLKDALFHGDSAAVKAAVNKNPSLIKMTMTQGAQQGNTLLNEAAFWGNLDLVKYLVGKGSDINHAGFSGSSPLDSAAHMGRTDVLRFLLSKKANFGKAVHSAVFGDKAECLKILLDAGAKVDTRDAMDSTPLFRAAERGKPELVKMLLAKGANPNAKGFMNKTILTVTRDKTCLALLKKAGAK